MSYKWYKYRVTTSGSISEWKYIHVSSYYKGHPRWISEYLNGLGLLPTWSEHYRGVEIVPAKKVPIEVIRDALKETEAIIRERKEERYGGSMNWAQWESVWQRRRSM